MLFVNLLIHIHDVSSHNNPNKPKITQANPKKPIMIMILIMIMKSFIYFFIMLYIKVTQSCDEEDEEDEEEEYSI